MTDETTNHDLGLELRRKMFGAQGADEQIDNASDYMAPLQDIVTRICFGEGWQRPVFDKKTRSLLTLAMLTAMGRTRRDQNSHARCRCQWRHPRGTARTFPPLLSLLRHPADG